MNPIKGIESLISSTVKSCVDGGMNPIKGIERSNTHILETI